eukprot:GILI01016168.1.p1 GENE.GILI01016168.1~~GILI01016168.1.p1  ORF type:complete len:397 (+),score=102.71 GILI01016168.1:45-1235(+)
MMKRGRDNSKGGNGGKRFDKDNRPKKKKKFFPAPSAEELEKFDDGSDVDEYSASTSKAAAHENVISFSRRGNEVDRAPPQTFAVHSSSNSAVFQEGAPRPYTVSIAISDSILENAHLGELKAYIAWQVARSAVIYNIDEVIVFREPGVSRSKGDKTGIDNSEFLALNLQYFETPQYLRKLLLPMHKDLRYAGMLGPLEAPHHLKTDDICKYREGVVINRPVSKGKGSWVNCGLRNQDVRVDKSIQAGVRVTVKMQYDASNRVLGGEAVSPDEPREQAGIYWGYQTRVADSLSAVLNECPYEGGYDCRIGTSDRGQSVDEVKALPAFKHLLIVFGGLAGLEECVAADEAFELPAEKTASLFNHYLNTCPHQGTKTIRAEEAVLISLSALRPLIQKNS